MKTYEILGNRYAQLSNGHSLVLSEPAALARSMDPEFGEALQAMPDVPNLERWHGKAVTDAADSYYWSWAGGPPAQAKDAIMRQPWGPGMEAIESLSEQIEDLSESINLESIKRRYVWGPEGEYVEMERVWSGELDKAWRHSVRRRIRGSRIVTLYAPFGANAGASPEMLKWPGAAAVVATDVLEAAGYRVELMGYLGVSDTPRSGVHIIPLKHAQEPLDKGRVATVLGYSPVFRWNVLAAWCGIRTGVGYSFGTAAHYLLKTIANEGDCHGEMRSFLGHDVNHALIMDPAYSAGDALAEIRKSLGAVRTLQST